jgi:hypothetical protein
MKSEGERAKRGPTKRAPLELSGFLNYFKDQRRFTEQQIDNIIEAVGKLPNTRVKSERWTDDGSKQRRVLVDRRDELVFRMELATAVFAYHDGKRTDPASETEKRLKAIASPVAELLRTLEAANVIKRRSKKTEALDLILSTVHRQMSRYLPDSSPSADMLTKALRIIAAKRPTVLHLFGPVPAKWRADRKRDHKGEIELFVVNAWANYTYALEALNLAVRLAMRENRAHKKAGRRGTDARNQGDPDLTRFVVGLGQIYKVIWERDPRVSRPSPAQEDRQAGGPFIRFVRACLQSLDIEKSPEAIVHMWRARSDLIPP